MKLKTLEEIAEMLNVTVKRVKNWRKTGVIPKNCFIKIGATVYAIEFEIDNWINNSVIVGVE